MNCHGRRAIDELCGPADFDLDRTRSASWIPAMAANCVRVVAAPRA
jgi:hypothetical protein